MIYQGDGLLVFARQPGSQAGQAAGHAGWPGRSGNAAMLPGSQARQPRGHAARLPRTVHEAFTNRCMAVFDNAVM